MVRPATLLDSRRIWEIRNDPSSRIYSHDSEIIPFEHHNAWYSEKYFQSNRNKCYVVVEDGYVIGYCRIDLSGDIYLVSIGIDRAYRNRGYGYLLLSAAIKGRQKLVAYIFKNNLASQQLFKKVGFRATKETEEEIVFECSSLPSSGH